MGMTGGSNGSNDGERLEELESRQAFQEDTIASLNEALVAQQQRIAYLEKMVDLLIERYREVAPDIALPEEEAPPPHY
jgi:SlyX protein